MDSGNGSRLDRGSRGHAQVLRQRRGEALAKAADPLDYNAALPLINNPISLEDLRGSPMEVPQVLDARADVASASPPPQIPGNRLSRAIRAPSSSER
jgi:hypothetical protein